MIIIQYLGHNQAAHAQCPQAEIAIMGHGHSRVGFRSVSSFIGKSYGDTMLQDII